MNALEIFINGQLADQSEALKVNLVKVVSEFRNPLKRTGEHSYTIKFPKTLKNKALFNYETERNKIGKFRTEYSCEIHCNSVPVLVGKFIPDKYTPGFIEGQVYGTKSGRIADIIDSKKKLRDIESFTPVAFEGDKTVWEYLDKDLYTTESEIAFPYLMDSFAKLKSLSGGVVDGITQHLSYENFGVSHFTKAVFKKIFADAGYTVEGSILNTEAFRRLILLYTDSGDKPAYNYGSLNLTNAVLTKGIQTPSGGRPPRYGLHSPLLVLDGFDYKLYLANPEIKTKTGDQSFSLSSDGAYHCNFTSLYTFDIQVKAYAYNYDNTAGYAAVQTKQFLLFRDITDLERLSEDEVSLPEEYADLTFGNLADLDTYNTVSNTTTTTSSTTHTHRIQMTVKLKEGRIYRPQLYVGVLKSALPEKLMIATGADADNWLKITSVQGRTLLDPAKFLPDMSQLEFVNAIFKLFNLFYQVDEVNKVLSLYTRDEFFTQSKENILDLSRQLNLDDFTETPLTQEDIDETYFRWSGDESDYLLANTDYMEKVNGDVSDSVYQLPFSPLAFLKVKVDKFNNGVLIASGNELLPVALPATDSTDSAILDDFTEVSNFSYSPKLALYYGAGHLETGVYRINTGEPTSATQPNNFTLVFDRTPGLTGGIEDGAKRYKHIPKLGFFNAKEQPAYEIELLPATREFKLNETVGNTIYTDTNTAFITPHKAGRLDSLSLALIGEMSIPQNLYHSDLMTTDWSNFTEGVIRMDPVLYSKLNGRNIILIEDDLYLLESIKNYDLSESAARIKLYKMLSA